MECRICGGKTKRIHFFDNREIVQCESCGTKQVADPPMIDELEADELKYQETKSRDYQRHPQWDLEIEAISELIGDGREVLDVGCGDGTFLSLLSENWRKSGVELNLERAEQAKAKGIDVTICDILDADFPQRFDLITMYEVIEHLYRPAEVLRKARSMLVSDGLLVISTPDSDSAIARLRGSSWWSYHYPPHIFFFGHSSFENVISECGFRIAKRRFGIHGSPFHGGTARRIEDLASVSSILSKNPLGDRMFYYLKKGLVPPTL